MAKEKRVVSWRKEGATLVGSFRTAHLNDFRQTDALRTQLAATLTEPAVRGVALDCSGVVYLISEVFGIFIQAHKEQRAAGRRLALCGIEPEVMELLKANRLDGYLLLEPDVASAVAAVEAD